MGPWEGSPSRRERRTRRILETSGRRVETWAARGEGRNTLTSLWESGRLTWPGCDEGRVTALLWLRCARTVSGGHPSDTKVRVGTMSGGHPGDTKVRVGTMSGGRHRGLHGDHK